MLRWTVHLKGGPKKSYHAAVAVAHKVYSFAWYDRDPIDVHVFNSVSLRWLKLSPAVATGVDENPLEFPSKRWGHTAVLIEDVIYIWGGFAYVQNCNMLYAFNVDTHRWFKPTVSGTVPEARDGHSACVLGKVMYIFGGYTSLEGCTNDVYKLDTATMAWSLIGTRGTPAAPSLCHSATIIGTKMFVFGGRGEQFNYNNISVFDTETNCWESSPARDEAALRPEGRTCHSAFAYNGKLYVFGGHNYVLYQTFNDLWRFNPETFTWKKVKPRGKVPCSWKTRMGCCMVGDRIVLFGGYIYTSVPVDRANDVDQEVDVSDLYILDISPSLKTLCKVAVIQHGLEQSELPHNIKWELAAMSRKNDMAHKRKRKRTPSTPNRSPSRN